jgi:hypothetical protein
MRALPDRCRVHPLRAICAPIRLRACRGFALALLAAIGMLGMFAPPAAAHTVPGIQPSNYETAVDGTTPRVPGLTVRAVDLGNQLELTNDTGIDVVVLGYQGEPYLIVGPRGTFENRQSPATYLNRTRSGKTPVPSSADPSGAPDWQKIASSTTARWHDHRAHWMGNTDPPEVARNPGRRHVIDRWQIGLRRGTEAITVTGDLVWVPGPSPWGWLLGALGAAVVLVALSRTRPWRWVLAAALAVVIVSETTHVIGQWAATTTVFWTKFGASVYSIGGIALAVAALVWIITRPPHNATPAVLFAGLVVLLAGGLADLSTLTRSQLPTTFSNGVARLQVTVALGVGVGLAVAAAQRLRLPARTPPSGRKDSESLGPSVASPPTKVAH